ncbi:hypothetical protein JKP88DRAFT_231681 [Tribonema minus]|uniref:Uncharacterized protein n=1 Tax=Tribonema minus TaxID=303371 RepID=A0A835ZDA4_9STRA|nr:hypothetical protein JKP88DRAFT_231681 [Tribonema minus]
MAALTALRSAGSRVGLLVMYAMRAAAAVAFLSADMFFEREPHNKPSASDATVPVYGMPRASTYQIPYGYYTERQLPKDLVDRRLEVSTINMPFLQTYPAHFKPSRNKSAQTGARSQRDCR